MPLTTGTQLGHYEVLAPIGAGGMGEVYRAKDIRLDRAVAIKVLPADFAKDADRLKRFEQEARATSALNHPNILTVHDFGTHEGAPFIVAELLAGEELRTQLNNGALPVRKAIEYAQQITAGLAAAHEKGIVHRDLKPENLFVTTDGRVKILDFGLAKLKPQKPGAGVDSEAPTLKPLTNPGVVMGTVGYMSPEQVRGAEVDHRSDIFSFGMILYEMLAGERAFNGASMAELMSAILKEEPPELSETNAKIPTALDKIVRHCLEKKPELRFQSARDLGFALEALSGSARALAGRSGEEVTSLPVDAALSQHAGARALPGWRERIWMIAAGVLALALLALGVAYVRRPALEAETVRFFVTAPEKATSVDFPTISPDGRTLAFFATVEGKTQLWVRPLSATTARPLVEARGSSPFWSPDSQFLAFYEAGKLKKITLSGGTLVTLCDAPSTSGTWNREGVILFGAGPAGIKRISANGGAVTAVTTVDNSRGETVHRDPVFLPDGRHFLFYTQNSDLTKQAVYLAALDGGEAKQLLPLDGRTVGVATNPTAKNEGYLVFARQGALLAQSFDFSRNQLTGEPVRLAEQVKIPDGGNARFSLSANGTLVLMEDEANQQLAWFDRAGKKLGTVGPAGIYGIPRLSPDEQRLAVGRRDPQTQTFDIRLFDLARGTDMRFTFDPATDEYPLWSPDGSRIVWDSTREGIGDFYQKAASGAGQDEVLLRSASLKRSLDWSADGRFILYWESHPQMFGDLWVLPLEGERKPWPWLNTPFTEGFGKFSPDGKWIAYFSNETGRPEVYIQAFVSGAPASGGKWQISTNGGNHPQWRRDGRELYYHSADGKLMAVDVTLGAEVKAGTPKELFDLRGIGANRQVVYTKTGDGQRFLFVTSMEEASVPPFTVVLNWMAEMKK